MIPLQEYRMAEKHKITQRDVFLTGKIISLCRPDIESDILFGDWHSWFNNQKITEFLEHGNHPIGATEEADIIKTEMGKSSSLVLTIVSNTDGQLIGVISIKDIDHIQRRGEIALVTNEKRMPGAALEAMALMTTHAFDRLNLQKLYAGQHEGLWKWVNTLTLIGYRIEGLRRNHGFRNGRPYDVILTGITAEEFVRLRKERHGDILGGDAIALAAKRKKTNSVAEFREVIENFNKE
jgi:RimJ/RimL family protein N-acetyltransferase